METSATVLKRYRHDLELAAGSAPASENSLYSLLLQELRSLESAIEAGDQSAIHAHLLAQQQLFGRSFASGPAGEAAEESFNRLAQAMSGGT